MNRTKLFSLLLSALTILLASCKGDDIKTNTSEDNENGDRTPPASEAILKLDLDLTANILNDDKMVFGYEFAEQTQAVALIRSKATEDIIYLPLTLERFADNSTSATIHSVEVPLNGIKPQPENRWQIKLLAGGKWDADTKHLSFEGQSDYAPSEIRNPLVIDQPYVSSWQDIETDEDGLFVVGENGKTAVTLPVTPCGVVLSHHIESCKAQAPVEIDSLCISNESVSFGGYYDLSDSKTLKDMNETQRLTWNVTESNTTATFIFSKPLMIQNAEQLKGNDFIYIWGCFPTDADKTRFTVTASGKVNNESHQTFLKKTISEKSVSLEEGLQIEINSTLEIAPPAPLDGPLELGTTDNRTQIRNDGKDKVDFVVMQDGTDVTDQCTIYKQYEIFEDPINGHSFSSSKAGAFKFYATKGNKRSNIVSISVYRENEVDENGSITTGQLFCKNVTMSSGWHDVNKVWRGDGLLCWAAAASNMLQWWLEDLQRKGHTIPAKVPFGRGTTYSLKIFDEFVDCWLDYTHSTDMGIGWFMEGGGKRWSNNNGYCSPTKKGHVEDGGYFKGVLSPEAERSFLSSEYVVSYGAWSNWETIKSVNSDSETVHKRFTQLVTRLLNEGVCSLSIDSHETTLWGCELQNGVVVTLYIANSDDNATKLTGYNVKASRGRIDLPDYQGKTNNPTRIIRLTGLKAYAM